jgi:hypothetical protein
MMRESWPVRFIWSFRQRPFGWRRGRLAARLLAGRGGLGLTRGEFGLVLGPLALVSLFHPRLDLPARLRELGQTDPSRAKASSSGIDMPVGSLKDTSRAILSRL